MEVVDKANGIVGLRMTVALGPVLGTIVETSTIFYVDEKRHLFVYGLRGDEGPSSMRVVWLEPTAANSTVFHSYDMIGGWPAHLSRGHIVRMVREGFQEQHLALRDRVYSLQLRRSETAPRASLGLSVEPLGVCLVTGGCGFLGEHLVRMLSYLPGVSRIHVVDVQPPRRDRPSCARFTFHKGSITDADFISALFASAKPHTVFHLASVIDLRPGFAAQELNERVNRDATVQIITLAKLHGVRRLVYTSTIEAGYHANKCVDVDETTHPYMAHPTNPYQRTKIAAEREVLLAHSRNPLELVTIALRPAHIVGHPEWDKLCDYLKGVPVCFGDVKLVGGPSKGALMSMVWVENCALGHLLGACLATQPDVGGRAYYLSDFNENIVSVYHALAHVQQPKVCLPYWLLSLLVRACVLLHVVVEIASAGRISVLSPMMGLHDGALAAGLPGTVVATRAKRQLGYRDWVTRECALECCRKPAESQIGPKQVVEAVERAFAKFLPD
jgi:nucleoside-diphosphate-sugar epimerase